MFVRPARTIRAARNTTREDDVIEPRFNPMTNEIAAEFATRHSASDN